MAEYTIINRETGEPVGDATTGSYAAAVEWLDDTGSRDDFTIGRRDGERWIPMPIAIEGGYNGPSVVDRLEDEYGADLLRRLRTLLAPFGHQSDLTVLGSYQGPYADAAEYAAQFLQEHLSPFMSGLVEYIDLRRYAADMEENGTIWTLADGVSTVHVFVGARPCRLDPPEA